MVTTKLKGAQAQLTVPIALVQVQHTVAKLPLSFLKE